MRAYAHLTGQNTTYFLALEGVEARLGLRIQKFLSSNPDFAVYLKCDPNLDIACKRR